MHGEVTLARAGGFTKIISILLLVRRTQQFSTTRSGHCLDGRGKYLPKENDLPLLIFAP
jgi:hypothetical protein